MIIQAYHRLVPATIHIQPGCNHMSRLDQGFALSRIIKEEEVTKFSLSPFQMFWVKC